LSKSLLLEQPRLKTIQILGIILFTEAAILIIRKFIKSTANNRVLLPGIDCTRAIYIWVHIIDSKHKVNYFNQCKTGDKIILILHIPASILFCFDNISKKRAA